MFKLSRRIAWLFVWFAVLQNAAFAQSGYERADLWKTEIADFAKADNAEFPKKGGVVFVGSSSIRMWENLAADFPGFHTVNRGFGGSHLEDVNYYAAQIVLPYKPKLIVLYAGENDIVDGKSPERIFADFKLFVSVVHKSLPKTRIIFVSLKPSLSRWQFAAKFKQANQLVKAETETDKRLLFVDVWEKMLGADGLPKANIFKDDKLHLNADGYIIWREVLLPQVKRGLKKNFR